ncbi:MAG: DUF1847 domain-containing protein [Puniceicoccales bacterium]|jgi:uncharacterized metal-binding protein|nr:DUF1847 domain-containing protein [Puniceicoccales bacterium]
MSKTQSHPRAPASTTTKAAQGARAPDAPPAGTPGPKAANAFSCADCGVVNCFTRERRYPANCQTGIAAADPALLDESLRHYQDPGAEDSILAAAAIDVEGTYYGRLTRVEETIAFAHRIGAVRIGIATCVGLMEETRVLAKILRAHGLQPHAAICKAGSVDKCEIGVPDSRKVRPGHFEPLCNPILQARLLARAGTQLNVIVGLCVGHDTLFIKYSEAPVTCLVVKDRVTGHNPAAPLHCVNFYYKRLLSPAPDALRPKPGES